MAANVGGKCMQQMLAANLRRIVKLLRHIIYDRNKADVKISSRIKNIGAKAMHPSEKSAPKLCVCLLFGLGRISNC